ncbi:DUF1996 domain-containing protein [Streptomyces sp. ST2-7A]|uniref:DUF1996 domain-containing protein n=1 Tax=Streptomyces sp. ST2-7A TaxID=2907214 RepID=UPI001F16E847|nr:DUF1996 domain-containing protein [Streptomyces sp. ST2-7A]MCE7083070.1 DUF1996 domain-containing protein [Streptomyces sp. ST2-7A]
MRDTSDTREAEGRGGGRRNRGHKRRGLTTRLTVLVTTLAVGAAGTVIATQYASAGNKQRDTAREQTRGQAWHGTIRCPNVGDQLEDVPDDVRARVDRELSRLDAQLAVAYRQLARQRGNPRRVMTKLENKRSSTIGRIVRTLGSVTESPDHLRGLAGCDFQRGRPGGNPEPPPVEGGEGEGEEIGGVGEGIGGVGEGEGDESGEPIENGPVPEDFVDITTVAPNVNEPILGENASTGTLSLECGRNEEGRYNSDNVIVAPGVSNGAHHMHDYVGNVSTDAFSTNESLEAADTTCANGDRSTHYWPVIRIQDGTDEQDADQPGGGLDGNIGTILTPETVTLQFRGNPLDEVTAMPRFLRIITGDARAFTNGTANANSSWSCTGFEDRQLTDRYPICPEGSSVVRTFEFQSCWDGENADSANHRSHVDFAREDGSCADGFVAIPQLVHRITYDVPPGAVYAVDSFPEQLHKPITDHSDFINVMTDEQMNTLLECVNGGERCGPE